MKFFGLQKTTLIDYPGTVAATLFTSGCNMRCTFCHNPDLVFGNPNLESYTEEFVLEFLNKRKNVLGGICITGGEPLIYHKELKSFISQVHDLGLKVKLDTNGTFPEELSNLNVDFIAMDIKTSFHKYGLFGYTGTNVVDKVTKSISYIMESGIDYEFRTTVVPDIVTIEDIKQILEIIKGAKVYSLNKFRPFNTLDKELLKVEPYENNIIESMRDLIESYGIEAKVRG